MPQQRAAGTENMVLCIIAFFVFAVMSIFSAKYRPLAREGFRCVFRTLMLKPCDTGLDERIKAEVVAGVLRYSPPLAKMVNRHFTLLSWLFVLITVVSLAYTAMGVYNFYFYGNCDGPQALGACILNDITGDYGRFSEPTQLIAPKTLDGMVAGNASANVTIIEFGCFTCPYTKEAEPTMKTLLRLYDGTVYYVFKPFPLPNHKNSFDDARAVLCAYQQNRSGQLQDLIFNNQALCASGGGSTDIKGLAQQAGLDMNVFNACFDNNETGAQLAAYVQEGKDAHIYATPTFFINGKPLVGPKSLSDFEAAIAAAGGPAPVGSG
jgi:protein-disulfide isomerase